MLNADEEGDPSETMVTGGAPDVREDMETLFTGGFVDVDSDDEDMAMLVTKKKNKKAKKEKRKSLPAKLPSQEAENEAKDNEESGSAAKAGKRKKKRQSTGSIYENEANMDSSPSSGEKSNKSKKIQKKSDDNDDLQEGEIEIFIPNKKYKGKYKEAFQKDAEKSLSKGQGQSSTLENGDSSSPVHKSSPFASFDIITKTPPAFVRKAIAKVAKSSEKHKKVRVVVHQQLCV